jgi:mRNA interferase MazF
MKQSEIWLLDLEPTVGAEIRKTRPAIIVNDNALGRLPLKVIIPLTDWKERYEVAPWMVKLLPDKQNGLSKESAADCFQMRSVSEGRFTKLLGRVSSQEMAQIREALKKVLSID